MHIAMHRGFVVALASYSNNSSKGSLARSVMGLADTATGTFTAAPLAAPKVGRVTASIMSSSRDCASCQLSLPSITCLASALTWARSSLSVWSLVFSQ